MQVTAVLVLTLLPCVLQRRSAMPWSPPPPPSLSLSLSLKLTTSWMLNSLTVQLNSVLLCPFQSKAFFVTSSCGKVLVSFKQLFYEEDDGENLDQLVVIHGRPFLDHGRRNKASSYSITDEGRLRSWWKQPNWNETSNWQKIYMEE